VIPIWNSSLLHELRDETECAGNLFRRFDNDGIPSRKRYGNCPERNLRSAQLKRSSYTITGKLKGTIEATTPSGTLSSRQLTPLDTAINRPLYAGEEGNPIAHCTPSAKPVVMKQNGSHLESLHALGNTSLGLDNILPMLLDNHPGQFLHPLGHQMMQLHQL